MGSLTLIAKMRPQFMGKVVAALETLHSKWQALNVMKMITTAIMKKTVMMTDSDYDNHRNKKQKFFFQLQMKYF